MGRKTKRGNKSNAAQPPSAEASWVALPRKDKTQPTSSSKTGLTRRTTEGRTSFEDVLNRKEKKLDSKKALEFSPPVAPWSRPYWTAGGKYWGCSGDGRPRGSEAPHAGGWEGVVLR
jgi:hypothetical protein